MPTITVSKEEALDLLYEEQVEEQIVDRSRWSVHYRAIVKKDDKLYEMHYRVGATESQDEGPFEYEKEVVLKEVEHKPVERWEYVYVADKEVVTPT